MTSRFKTHSPPALSAIASLALLVVGGPLLWIGSFSAISASPPDWAATILTVGFWISAVALALGVLATLGILYTLVMRARRAKRIRRFHSPPTDA